MKHLTKVTILAVAAAVSLNCISAIATDVSTSNTDNESKSKIERHLPKPSSETKGTEEAKKTRERPQMTEEEKAAKLEEMKSKLAEKLSAGKITQEQYDNMLASIESGEFNHDKRGMKPKMHKRPNVVDTTEATE